MKSAFLVFSISLLALASLSFTAIPVEEDLVFLPVVLRSSSVANYGVDSDAVAFGPVKASIVNAAAADLGLSDPVINPDETDGTVPSIPVPDEAAPQIPDDAAPVVPDEAAPDESVIPDGVDKNDYKDADPDDGNNGSGNDDKEEKEDKDSDPDDGNNGSGNDDKLEKDKKEKEAKVDNEPSTPIPGGGTDNQPEKEEKEKKNK